jgi:glyoxylase-like metal-dependent hydrolase (beta-lactamase superfamily II)
MQRIPAALSIVIALSAAPSAAQQQPLEIERIAENLYVLKGGGANTTVFITSNGAVVVDTKGKGSGRAILDAVRMITDKPVTTVINTGPDAEHVGANAEFPAAVHVVAQRNTKKRMEKMGLRGRTLPTRTFRSKLTLFSGADAVDLYYFGRGHTDGDTWVVFRALGVVHVGDLFPGDDLPLLDAKSGGSALAIGQTLDNAYRRIKGATLIVTPHGGERTWAELREYASFNNQFVNDVWNARQNRKTVDDIVRDWTIPPGYEKYAPIDAERLKNNVAVTMREFDDEARVYDATRRLTVGDAYIGSRTATDSAPPPTPATVTSPPQPSAPPPDGGP